MPFSNEIRAGSSGQSTGFFDYEIEQSLRLDNASGAYLTIGAASPTATNRKKVAISCWVKRAGLSVSGVNTVFWSTTAGLMLQFFTADTIYIYDNNAGGYQAYVQPLSGVSRLFRDVGSWYHLALIIDTTQSTAADRSKFYVNGELNAQNSYPSENSDITWHDGSTMRIGSVGDSQDLMGYIAEFISIDGQDVSISDFGETKDGIWVPKDVSGLTLGNAGFYLPFSQTIDAGFSTLFGTRNTSTIVHSDTSSYDIGSSDDFTVEFFFNTPDIGANYGNFTGQYATSGPHHLIGYDFRSSTRNILWYTGNGAAFQWDVSGDVTLAGGKWHHMVFQRDGTTLRAYIDGTRLTTVTDAAGNTGYSLSDGKSTNFNKAYDLSSITIGDPHGQGFTGYMSNVRYVIGATVYANDDSNITVPTATLTAVTGTKLLTCINATVGDDISSENNDGSVTSATASTVNPFGTFNFFQDVGSNAVHFNPTNINDIDVMPDSPTNNWCVNNSAMRANITHSEANLKMVGVGTNFDNMASTFDFDVEDSGGWYWEYYSIGNDTDTSIGISTPQNSNFNQSDPTSPFSSTAGCIDYRGDGQKKLAGSNSSYGDSWTAGDIIGVAVKAGAISFYKNGTIQNSGTAATTGLTGKYVAAYAINGTNSGIVNYGQDDTFAGNKTSGSAESSDVNGNGSFYYAVPTGHKALCAKSLTDPELGPNKSEQATDHYQTALYEGTGATQNVTGVGFKPDWVWVKRRDGTQESSVMDSVRGFNSQLRPAVNNVESTKTDCITSFDSDGFTLGADAQGNNSYNYYTDSHVAWCWKAGGAPTATNSEAAGAAPTSGSVIIDGVASTSTLAGSIAATKISANTKAGFSIGTFTKGSGAETVAHGLNAALDWYVVKRINGSGSWFIYQRAMASDAETDYIRFNSTAAKSDDATVWDDTAPTDSVFTVAAAFNSGEELIFYAGHNVEGFSKFGAFAGNSNDDGTFVYCGFKPARIWLKRSDSSTVDWTSYDLKREGFNQENDSLRMATAGQEQADDDLDILSNGFKMRRNMANNQGTIIFFAWADSPFKFANAR